MLVQIRLWSLQDKRTQKYLPLVIKIEWDSQEWQFSVSCYLIWSLFPFIFSLFFTWTWSVMCTTDITALQIASDSFPEQIPPVSWRKIGPGGGREVLHNYIIQGLCQNSWRQGTFINFWLTLQRVSAWRCGISWKSLETFELILRKSNVLVFVDISFSVLSALL